MALGTPVTLHTWNRRDRSAMEAWPESIEPLAWLWAYSPRLAPIERTSWGIAAAGELVGRVTLRGLDDDASLGIYLRPDCLGQGIGRAALALALDLAFGAYDRKRIGLDVALTNMRAVRCYMAVGFTVTEAKWWKIPDHPSLHELKPNHVFLGPPHYAVYWHMRLTAMEWEEYKERTHAPAHALSRGGATSTGA